jgi:mannitol operon repressor
MTDTREEFLARNPHLVEFLPFLDDLNAESSRGRAMIAAAYLDELLKRVLLGYMRDVPEAKDLVTGHHAPLGTFDARIEACFALGLINDEERSELKLIRRIRNDFAHDPKARFNDQSIADRCRNLKFRVPGNGQPEGHFASAAVPLIMRLLNRAHYVRQQRRTFVNWPL